MDSVHPAKHGMKKIQSEQDEKEVMSLEKPQPQLHLSDNSGSMQPKRSKEEMTSTENVNTTTQPPQNMQKESDVAMETYSRDREFQKDICVRDTKTEDENSNSHDAGKRDSKNTTPTFSSSSSSQQDNRILSKMREEKRQKMKDYLKELQTLVALDKDQKPGTLSLLKEVLGRMKTLSKEQKSQGNNSDGSQSSRKSSSGQKVKSSGKRYLVPSQSSRRSTSDLSLGDFYVILNIDTGRMVDIGQGLLDLLHFHKDNMKDEEFVAFMHRSDMCTFRTIMSACRAMLQTSGSHVDESKSDETCSSDESGNLFFFRLRQYKSLVQRGFSLSNPKQFVIFRGLVNVKKTRLVDGSAADPQHIVLDCTPVTSAYHSPKVPPAKRYFTTRHTMLCVYNFVDAAAVELLGYLPHDMIGTSIFDYYHPDDLPQILSAYQEVLKGKTIKTTPYRLRVKNGSYILVTSELSSFFNVWSHKLELIISRHEVLQGPDDIAVFSDPVFMKQTTTQLNLNEIANLRCSIESLLLNTSRLPDKRFERSDTAVSCPGTEEKSGMAIDELVGTNQMVETADKTEGKAKSKSFKVVENAMMKNRQERDIMYGQLNYAHTIKRYLMSQTILSSDESEKRSSSPDELDSSMLSDELVDVDIPCMPKAPSFASSTKALVSEHEDAPHSPLILPPVDDLSNVIKEDSGSTSLHTNTSQVAPLTKESLSIHTKLMEEKYIMDFTRDQNNPLAGNGQGRQCLKRTSKSPSSSQSKGNDTTQPSRKKLYPGKQRASSRKSDLCPPFPFTTPSSGYHIQPMFIQHMQHGQLGQPPGVEATISHKDSAVFSLPMDGIHYPPAGSSASQDKGIHWPFYPQSGVSFMPQVMSGFLEADGSGSQQSKSKTAAVANPFAKPSHLIITSGISSGHTSEDGVGHAQMALQQEDNSDEKDGSSMSFLLDMDNLSQKSNTNASSSNTEESVFKRPRNQFTSAPWLTNLRHKKDVIMKYTIPKRNLSQILHNDKKKLKRMAQQPIVGVQLSMLLNDMGCSSPPQDEEADLLFSIRQSQKTVTFREPDKMDNSRKSSFHLRHKANRKRLKESMSSASRKHSGKLFALQPSFKPASERFPIKQSVKSVVKASQNSSGSASSFEKNEEESDVSDITRSEDRSNDETGSSLKESDGSSYEGTKSSSKYTSSESELEHSENQHLPDQLFTNLNVAFSQLSHHLPPWLAEVNFSPHEQYRYKIKSPPLKDVLEQDRKRLNNLVQPELISVQIMELISEVNLSTDHSSEKGMSQSLSSDFGGNKSSLTGSASDDKPSADSDPNCNDQKSVSRSDTSNNENELTEEQTDRVSREKDLYSPMNLVLDREFQYNEMKEIGFEEIKEQSKNARIKEYTQSGSDKLGTESGEYSSNNSNESKLFASTYMRGQEVESVCTLSSAASYPSNVSFIKKVFKTIKDEDDIDIDNLVFSLD